MKKIIASFILVMFIGLSAQAASFKGAISKYKSGNYAGCINELEDMVEQMSSSKNKANEKSMSKLANIISKYDVEKWKDGDSKSEEEEKKMLKELNKEFPKLSTEKSAYILYYYALCYHQLGSKGEAKNYYKAASSYTWKNKSQIYLYSQQAMKCIDNPNACQGSDMDAFIKSGKQVSDEIIKEELQRTLKRHQQEINQGKELSTVFEDNTKLAWADSGINPDIADQFNQTTSKVSSDIPTDEEIGKAVRTLQKAGINPMTYMPVNNEYAQLNSILNNGNNYTNDYATMMMMNNSNGQLSPQVMQTLMQQQMMGGFGF